MKRLSFYFVVCFLALQSQAQTVYGVKGGASITNLKSEGWQEKRNKVGMTVGLFAESKLNNQFFLRPELLFSTKGFKFQTDAAKEGVVNLNYISVPFLAGFRPKDKIAILAGPEFGYLQDAKSKHDGKIYDLTRSYGRFDLCLNLGFQYNFSKQVGIDLRYSHGLIPFSGAVLDHIPMDYVIDYIGVYKAKNRSLQLNVFYIFSNR